MCCLARTRTFKGNRPPMPKYSPKSRGRCGITKDGKDLGGCGGDVCKGATRYKGAVWHTKCLVEATKSGNV